MEGKILWKEQNIRIIRFNDIFYIIIFKHRFLVIFVMREKGDYVTSFPISVL